MTDCSGLRVVFGHVHPPELLDQARAALERIGGQSTDKIESLVTTHFVCTAVGASGAADAAYQRALQLSLPAVLPSWLLACDAAKRLAPVQPHYLGTSSAGRPAAAVEPASKSGESVPPSALAGGDRQAGAVSGAGEHAATGLAAAASETDKPASGVESAGSNSPGEPARSDDASTASVAPTSS